MTEPTQTKPTKPTFSEKFKNIFTYFPQNVFFTLMVPIFLMSQALLACIKTSSNIIMSIIRGIVGIILCTDFSINKNSLTAYEMRMRQWRDNATDAFPVQNKSFIQSKKISRITAFLHTFKNIFESFEPIRQFFVNVLPNCLQKIVTPWTQEVKKPLGRGESYCAVDSY